MEVNKLFVQLILKSSLPTNQQCLYRIFVGEESTNVYQIHQLVPSNHLEAETTLQCLFLVMT